MHAACDIVRNIPISLEGEEVSLAIVEHISAEVGGILQSDEIDCLRWTFRAVNGQWILITSIQRLRPINKIEATFLMHQFLVAAKKFEQQGKHLILEDSRLTASRLYQFWWPIADETRLVVFAPEEILEQCGTEVEKRGLFRDVTINVWRLQDR